MAERKWILVGSSGDFVKWTEKGQTLEGVWQGSRPGRFGDLGVLLLANGKKVSFPLHTVLTDRFKRIREGAEVHIEYLGKATNKKGTEYKDFDIGVGDLKDIIPETAEEGQSEEVPF